MKNFMITLFALFWGAVAFAQPIDCSDRNIGEIFVSGVLVTGPVGIIGSGDYKACNSYTTRLNVTLVFPNNELSALAASDGPLWTHLINLGDGNGFVPISSLPLPLTAVNVTYPSRGIKGVQIVRKLPIPVNGTQFIPFGNFSFTINNTTSTYFPPDEILSVTTTETYTLSTTCNAYNPAVDVSAVLYQDNVVGTANAYIRFGIGHTELVKPIIVVDGLDFSPTMVRDPSLPTPNNVIRFGANGWDALVTGTTESYFELDDDGNVIELSEFRLYPTLVEDVYQEGYDLIFLDFSRGADYIQKNAILLKELLLLVNNRKVADPVTGIEHENIVMGASMGGQVARYALAKMEKDGIDHCTQTYISFDSPHKGANIPLGIQSAAWFSAMTAETPSDRQLWDQLSFPAPRQLLLEHFGKAYQDGRLSANAWTIASPSYPARMDIDYGCLRTEYLAELEALGYPQNTRNVAISCGSIDGINQGYNPNDQLYAAGFKITSSQKYYFRAEIRAGGNGANITSTVRTCLGGGVGVENVYPNIPNTIFLMARPASEECLFNKLPEFYHSVGVTTDGSFLDYDNAPGCYRRDIVSIHKAIKESLDPQDKWYTTTIYDFLPSRKRQCFMPTMSTLDLDFTMTNNSMALDLTPYDIVNLSPFDAYYAPTGYNLKHVEIDEPMKDWLMNELLSSEKELTGELPALNGNTTYNFGLTKKRITGVDINDGGVLRVNNSGPTSYLNEADSDKKIFEAYTARSNACNGSGGGIIINSGGRFILGDDLTDAERRAIVHISPGSKVEVNAGGILRVAKGSQLIIEPGAQLVINAGARIDLWWNDFWFDGGTIEGSNILIKDGGELIINGDFDFSGSGFFQFDKGNIFTLKSNWKFKGTGKGNRFMRLNEGAVLDIPVHDFEFSRGLIEYDTNSYIYGTDGASARFVHMDFEGIGTNNDLAYHALSAHQMDQINVLHCSFREFSEAIQLEDMMAPTSRLNIQLGTFDNCEFGIFAYGARDIRVSGSTFTSGSQGLVGFYLFDAVSVDISSSRIEGYPTGIYVPGYGIGGDDDNDGIDDGEANNTNIILRGGTTLSDNKYGVHIEKGGALSSGQLFGTLEMDCAKLINNRTGVLGKNILLEIDACKNSGQPADCDLAYVNPNTFINAPGGLVFDIDYQENSEPPFFLSNMISNCEVSAIANYWQSGNGFVGPLPGTDYSLDVNPGICSNINLVMNDNFNIVPQGCSNNPPTKPGEPEPGPTDIKADERGNVVGSTEIENTLIVFPNPTTADFTVRFGMENAIVSVKNVLGQTIFKQEASDEIQVSTDSWEAGLYLIEVKNLKTSESWTHKMILQ